MSKYCVICRTFTKGICFTYDNGCFVCVDCNRCNNCCEKIEPLFVIDAKTAPRVLCSECLMIVARQKMLEEYRDEHPE